MKVYKGKHTETDSKRKYKKKVEMDMFSPEYFVRMNFHINDTLKPLLIGESSIPISVSENYIKFDGKVQDTTHFENIKVDHSITCDNSLNIESDGTINLTTSADSVSNDINLNTGGRDLTILNGEEKVIAFSNGGAIVPTLVLYAWNGNTDDYFQISSGGNNGETTISTVDAAAEAAHLTIDPDGDLNITPNADVSINLASGGEFILQENSSTYTPSADTHVATKKYVDDNAGGNYQYQFMPIGFYSTSTSANYLPLTGYILERTSTAGQNEYISYIAPYNGTIEKIIWRSEIAQDGNVRVMIYESADGTEVPSSNTGRYDTTVDIADDTTYELNLATASATSGDNNVDKHKIYAISIQFPSAPYDTNVSVVWKWDITT